MEVVKKDRGHTVADETGVIGTDGLWKHESGLVQAWESSWNWPEMK